MPGGRCQTLWLFHGVSPILHWHAAHRRIPDEMTPHTPPRAAAAVVEAPCWVQVRVVRVDQVVYTALAWILYSSPKPSPANPRRPIVKWNGLLLHAAIVRLTTVATVVRLEIAMFLLPVVLSLCLDGRRSVWQAIVAGIYGGFGSLSMSPPT